MTCSQTGCNSIGNNLGQNLNRTNRVIVTWNTNGDLIWVTVGVKNSDNRNAELLSLGDSQVLFVGVNNPDRRRRLGYVANTTESFF